MATPAFADSIRIERGSSEDLDQVMDVMTRAFGSRFGEAWTRSQLAGILPMAGVVLSVASESKTGDTIGFSLLRSVADEAELLLLAVLPDRHRQGIRSDDRLGRVATAHEREPAPQVDHVLREVDGQSPRHAELGNRVGTTQVGTQERVVRLFCIGERGQQRRACEGGSRRPRAMAPRRDNGRQQDNGKSSHALPPRAA